MSERSSPTAGERAAALAALVTVLAAVVLVLIGIIAHVASVILAAIALLISVTSCWYAVSRRGVVRVIAAVLAVAALAGLVVCIFLADITVWRVIAIIALSVLSVWSARYALRRSASRLRADQARAAVAARPHHPVLIMNPKSGGGKAERFQLADECRKRGIEPVVLRPGDNLLKLAEDAVSRGADVIGMAGGDGSQALVASVAARHDIPHVCIPAGTRNHFALDLGLDRSDVVGALDAFTDGVERRIDLATINGRTFVNNASLGLYAKVVQSPEYRDAKLKTAGAMLPDFLAPGAAPLDIRFAGPDGAQPQAAQLVLVSNNPYQLVHLGGRGTRERIDRGLLGVVAITIADAGRRRAVRGARGQRPAPALPRLAGMEHAQVRGQLRSLGRGRSRRRGPGHGSSAGIRVKARRAASAPAAARARRLARRARGPPAVPFDGGGTRAGRRRGRFGHSRRGQPG